MHDDDDGEVNLYRRVCPDRFIHLIIDTMRAESERDTDSERDRNRERETD